MNSVSNTALRATIQDSESLYSWFDQLKMVIMWTGVHGRTVLSGLKNLVVRARVSSTGRNAQMQPVSTISHCNGPRKCAFVFDTVKMATVLTGIHERAGFPGLEELFSSVNGYLVHHSPKDIDR